MRIIFKLVQINENFIVSHKFTLSMCFVIFKDQTNLLHAFKETVLKCEVLLHIKILSANILMTINYSGSYLTLQIKYCEEHTIS